MSEAAAAQPQQCSWVEGQRQCSQQGTKWAGSRWLCAFHFKVWLRWRKWDEKK